jgi:hypothetical protein
MMVMTRRPAAEAVSSDSATEINATPLLEEFQQTAEVLDTAREPVEFGNNHRLDFAAVHQGEQTLQAGAVQVLGRFPAVHDDLKQLGPLHRGHGANLGFLGLEGNALLRLPVR